MVSKAWNTVADEELSEWLRTGGEEARELVVQVKTPARKVAVSRDPGGRVLPTGIKGADAASREEAIRSLAKALEEFVDEPPVILKSAGAVLVRATSSQARKFVDHPLVKAIFPNRRLRKSAL